jgi:Fur family transcriptional regulator, iron response regulator
VREVFVDPARVFYDSDTSVHHHLYDTDTGELVDIPADAIQICGVPVLPAGRVAERIDIIIRARRAV